MKSNNSKSIIVALAALLTAAFFMPWIKFFVSANAWDMVFGDVIDSPVKYLALVIPLSGIVIVYSAAFNNEKYPVSKKLLFALPLITLVIIAIIIITKIGDNGDEVKSSDLGEMIKIFGIGFWLTLISAIILPFLSKETIATKSVTPPSIPTTEVHNLETPVAQTVSEKIIVVPEQNITAQAVNSPMANFGKMNRQRKFVLIAAAAGIISTFLPWISYSVSLFGYTESVQSYNGMRDIGILAFLCFAISGAVAYMGDQSKNLDKTMWGTVLVAGAIALLSVIGFYFNKSNASIMGNSHAGFGLYLAALAAIGVLGSAYLLRSPTDNIKDSLDSMKKNIENKLNQKGDAEKKTDQQDIP